MSQFDYKGDIYNKSFYVGDFMKYFFKSQGIEPYLPLKSEVVNGIVQPKYRGNYKIWNYAMPYDIESEHLKKQRDTIRTLPIEFKWTESELKEYESLPNEDLKRRMILDKVDMKSIYLPKLKYEKDFIDYPSLPADEKSKSNFAKGFELYNTKNEESKKASISYLESSASAGNYIAHEMLSRYYLDEMINLNDMNNTVWEKASTNFMQHCEWLIKANLPVGYYLMSVYDSHYLEINRYDLSSRDINIMYDSKIYPNMVKALELGSYDLLRKMAVHDSDLEWALCAMILTGKSDVFNSIAGGSEDEFPATPRNMAILKLATMLGSSSALDMFLGNYTELFEENFLNSLFFHDVTEEYNYSSLSTCNDLTDTKKICEQYINSDSFLIPDIDKIIPPSTVLFTPYAAFSEVFDHMGESYADYLRERNCMNKSDKLSETMEAYKSFPYKDPRSEYSTLEHKKKFRKLMSSYDAENSFDNEWAKKPEKCSQKWRMEEFIEDGDYEDEFPEEIFEYFGYANALKKRELEMNPHYYKLARPYVFPEEVYKERSDWY